MKVKLRKNEQFFAQVEFEDVNYSFVNSIRRSLVSMVPCLAIHEVDFHMGSLGAYVDEESGEEKEYESISAMFNEIVAHRIGMLPIPTDEKTVEAFGESIGDDSKQPDIMYSHFKVWGMRKRKNIDLKGSFLAASKPIFASKKSQ